MARSSTSNLNRWRTRAYTRAADWSSENRESLGRRGWHRKLCFRCRAATRGVAWLRGRGEVSSDFLLCLRHPDSGSYRGHPAARPGDACRSGCRAETAEARRSLCPLKYGSTPDRSPKKSACWKAYGTVFAARPVMSDRRSGIARSLRPESDALKRAERLCRRGAKPRPGGDSSRGRARTKRTAKINFPIRPPSSLTPCPSPVQRERGVIVGRPLRGRVMCPSPGGPALRLPSRHGITGRIRRDGCSASW